MLVQAFFRGRPFFLSQMSITKACLEGWAFFVLAELPCGVPRFTFGESPSAFAFRGSDSELDFSTTQDELFGFAWAGKEIVGTLFVL